jgi:hypothetical protein
MLNRTRVPESIIVFAAVIASVAAAQERQPKAELFGGYQYTRVGAVPGMNADGWNAAVTGVLNRWAGFTADFSGAYKRVGVVGINAHTFTFGPVVSARGERVTPFAHALFGGFRASTSAAGFSAGLNGFAMMIGGGVDVRATRRLAVRVAQLDWILWNSAEFTERKNARVSVGLVFRFN